MEDQAWEEEAEAVGVDSLAEEEGVDRAEGAVVGRVVKAAVGADHQVVVVEEAVAS